MSSFFSTLIGRILFVFASLLLPLAFIPILFPFVITMGLLILIASSIQKVLARRTRVGSMQKTIFPREGILKNVPTLPIPDGEEIVREISEIGKEFTDIVTLKEEEPAPSEENRSERRARRNMRLSLRAIVINASLYGFLLFHSYACYIHPLSKDLEPVRNLFRTHIPHASGERTEKKNPELQDIPRDSPGTSRSPDETPGISKIEKKETAPPDARIAR